MNVGALYTPWCSNPVEAGPFKRQRSGVIPLQQQTIVRCDGRIAILPMRCWQSQGQNMRKILLSMLIVIVHHCSHCENISRSGART
jgi:hypothetical protein